MRVSVIIPTLNSARTLPACLSSVFKQTFTPSEIIIVDQGSTDNTRRIAMNAGCKVRFCKSRTIAGLRNEGVRISSGKVLAFIDSDCIAGEEWLSNALKNLEKHDLTGAEPKCPKKTAWITKAFSIHRENSASTFIPTHAVCIRKSTFDKIGGFNENLKTCEDCDLTYRLIDKGYSVKKDPKLAPLHLGEPRTITQFFWKQVWHGSGMLKLLITSKYKTKRFKVLLFSLLIPLSIALSMAGLQTENIPLASIPVGLTFMILLTKAALTGKKHPKWIPALMFAYAVYSTARFYSLVCSAVEIVNNHFRA